MEHHFLLYPFMGMYICTYILSEARGEKLLLRHHIPSRNLYCTADFIANIELYIYKKKDINSLDVQRAVKIT